MNSNMSSINISSQEGRLPTRKISVFLLAAPEDQLVCAAIVKHLKPVVREFARPVELASDFDAGAGDDLGAHRQRLASADIVLVLISSDFISNDEVYDRVKAVSERHNRGDAVMIPLLVRNCLWKATPFARLDMLPKNFQPLNNLQFWPSSDDALTAVVTDIYSALNVLANKGTVELPPGSVQQVPGPAPGPATAAAKGLAALPQTAAAVAAEAPAGPAPGFGPAAEQVNVDWRQAYYRKLVSKRAAAVLIDFLVALPAAMLVLMVYAVFLGLQTDEDNFDAVFEQTFNTAWNFTWFAVFYVICPLFEASVWQATIGKRMMGLQITDKDGGRIGFWRAFMRTVLRSLVLYSYVLSLGILLVVQYFRFKTTKRLFHDEISSTVIGERLERGKAPTMALIPA